MDTDLIIRKIHSSFDGGFKVGVLDKKNIGRHSDGFIYFVSGKAEYVFDSYSFVADSKSFFYLAKDSIYSINVIEEVKFICVDFDFAPADKPRQSCVFNNLPPSIKTDFSKLFYLCNKSNPWHNAQAFGILYNIYSAGIKSENKEYSKKNQMFSKAASFIFEHYTEPELSVNEIANHLDISEVHLRRIFKASANISPVRYINFLRIEKAKNMLRSSNFTVAEIAESVGFEDQFYFSRLFKKETGLSPVSFRRIYDETK